MSELPEKNISNVMVQGRQYSIQISCLDLCLNCLKKDISNLQELFEIRFLSKNLLMYISTGTCGLIKYSCQNKLRCSFAFIFTKTLYKPDIIYFDVQYIDTCQDCERMRESLEMFLFPFPCLEQVRYLSCQSGSHPNSQSVSSLRL